ncbi:MAG: ribosomal-processing cysteine protease Prp [Clostridiales bacterium]|nr:ribosomal-processing cysteine protease Prp [Clostridiales bacterium]
MVRVKFFQSRGLLRGFEISGHAGFAPIGEDIVCAAVSSAAYMLANTITEVMGINAKIKVDEAKAYMFLELNKDNALKCQELLKGFELHIRQFKEAHGQHIKVIYGGV